MSAPNFTVRWMDEFGPEYEVEQPLLDWFERHGFMDDSWHNNICPSYTLLNTGTRGDPIVEIFVDAQEPTERECGPGPRFSIHWFDEEGDRAEHFEFHTFAEVKAHVARVMESEEYLT